MGTPAYVTTYVYDPNTGDLTDVDYPDGSNTPDVDYTRDRLGRPTTIIDASTNMQFVVYDDLAATIRLRVEKEKAYMLGGVVVPKELVRKIQGTGQGELPGRSAGFAIGPWGQQGADYDVTYGYDAKGRLGSITGTGLPAGGVQYTYKASTDLLGGLEYQDGSQTTLVSSTNTYEFDEQNKYRPLRTVVENKTHPGTVTTVSKYTYAYDPLGRRTSVVYTGSAFAQSHLFKWGYNPRSEVVDADRHEGTDPDQPGSQYGTNGDFVYAYDPIGNRRTFTLDGAGTPLRYCTNNLNQYEDTYAAATPDCPPTTPIDTFDYDEDGNLVDDGVFDYTWDMENRLIRIEPNSTPVSGDRKLEFQYDYRSRRVRKTSFTHNGTSWVEDADLLFIYDGWNVVLVLDANDSNAITRKYTWGLDLSGLTGNASRTGLHGAGGIGGLLAAVETSGTYAGDHWFFYDANGNVGQLVENTTGYPVAAHYEYDPYGNAIAATGTYANANPFRFSTKWLDTELAAQGQTGAIGPVGLYYYGYRYYSTTLGRWMSWDTIGEEGDLNLQGFIRNRPTVTVDVLGRDGFGCFDTPWGTVCSPPRSHTAAAPHYPSSRRHYTTS